MPEEGIQNEIEGISYGKNKSEKRHQNLTKYNRASYFFVAPFVIVFLIFSVYPVFRTLVLSFTDSKLAGMPYHFVGLKNYTRVFTDKFFWRALWNTIRIWGVNIVLRVRTRIFADRCVSVILNINLRAAGVSGHCIICRT